MNINEIIHCRRPFLLNDNERKIPWNDPDFSQRMLENHLQQTHDWASRRFSVIDRQVDWITQQLPQSARILDLGCGPGLYCQRLAKAGFACTGVDFSPAAIAWARQQANDAGLAISYVEQDVRQFVPTHTFDLVMMTFGELNVFSAEEAQALLKNSHQWLAPDGKLLLELHTFEEVQRQGQAERQWQPCETGLFLPVPHLLLTENQWDDENAVSTTVFWTIDENGKTIRFGNQMKAWRNDEYVKLLSDCGFSVTLRPDATTWPVSETFTGKLFTLLAEKQ